MLYTYVHHKEYSGASWDVAHLYEHIVTRSFQKYLESLDIQPGLIGNTSGDTFEHVIFLNATFYDRRVADAYEYFLKTPSLIDASLIPQMLLEIETEDREILTLQDQTEFDAQLTSLLVSPWTNNALVTSGIVDESSYSPDSPYTAKRSAKDFRDIVVSAYVDIGDLDDGEQTLFLRLSVIAGDVIGYALRRELHGTYHIGLSPISKDVTIMGSMQHVRFRRDISLKQIQEVAEGVLHAIDIQSAMPFITAQFEEFADRATWRSLIVDYYRHTGILTTNAYISSLATPERITSILSKLKIHVRQTRKSDEEWFL